MIDIGHLSAVVREQVASNQFLAGGFVLGIIGALIHWCKGIPGRAWQHVKQQMMIEITISDKSEAFGWIVAWMAAQPYSQRRARRLSVHTERAEDDAKDRRPRIIFSPAAGTHWMFWRGRLVYMNRSEEGAPNDGSPKIAGADSSSFWKREHVTLTIMSRNRELARALIHDAREVACPPIKQMMSVIAYRWEQWRTLSRRKPRPLDSVILRNGLKETLLESVSEFKALEDWYVERGIPHRLGILLSGPPGSGKSSLIAALAGHFGMDVAMVNLASASLDDEGLLRLLADAPNDALLMIEDIDCVFEQRSGTEDKKNKITFSGLLNALDGVAASEGRILVMTSNHPERLDPALVRPGRVDLRLEIGAPDADQVGRLFERFFPDAMLAESQEFVVAIGEPSATSMASLQGLLKLHRTDNRAAIEAAYQLGRIPAQPD